MEALRKILRVLVVKYLGPYDEDRIGTELGGLVSKLSAKYPPKILVRVNAEISKWERRKFSDMAADIYMNVPIVAGSGPAMEAVEILRVANKMILS